MITYLSGWVSEQCGAAFPVPQAAWESTEVTLLVSYPNIHHMITYSIYQVESLNSVLSTGSHS